MALVIPAKAGTQTISSFYTFLAKWHYDRRMLTRRASIFTLLSLPFVLMGCAPAAAPIPQTKTRKPMLVEFYADW